MLEFEEEHLVVAIIIYRHSIRKKLNALLKSRSRNISKTKKINYVGEIVNLKRSRIETKMFGQIHQ